MMPGTIEAASRAAIAMNLNVNVLHADKPPAVACAAYYKQWRALRRKRATEQLDLVCRAKPGKRRQPTAREKRNLQIHMNRPVTSGSTSGRRAAS